jgi:hypothetical protein
MSFCPGTPKLGVSKFSKLGLMALWKAITSCAQLVESKVVTLVKSFPNICGMPPTHMYFKVIFDF